MNFGLFLFCLFSVQVLCIFIGRKSYSSSEDREGYFLAGRSLQIFPLAMTFIATQIGGGVLLGAAEEAAHYGYRVIFYPLGVALGLILLGVGPGKKLASGSIVTIVTLFESVYQSPKLRKLAFVISALSLFFILVAQIIALDKLFHIFSYGTIFTALLTAIFWGILALYTSAGGFRGVVRTDMIQAIFLIAAVCFCTIVVWLGSRDVPLAPPNFSSLPVSKLSSWVFMPMVFMLIEQDMAQRCIAAASPRKLQWAAIFAGVVMLIFNFFPLFLGSLGTQLGLPPDCILIHTVSYIGSPSLAAVMAAAIGIAILSTADSLMSALAQLISEEIPPLASINSRYLILAIALLVPLIAIGFTNIVDVLMLSYSFSVCCLSVPIGAALLTRYQATTLSAWAAVLVGGGAYIWGMFSSFYIPRDVFAWLCSLVAFIVVEVAVVHGVNIVKKQV
ncbi:proline permease [Chlamydia gallinacea 08-1274/3]|uniref:Proline permease n=1 Tax=Chlamydia gallinacea 08-1274/3 TaxID=1143323 RepID=A0A173DZJ0_9CHLA|nr:sodium:solute symporter family protein [Chlamydia gallinacea]ANG66317.1 proline permease [Chlamydia gallinacea 08-1274/3]AQT77479.1 proline permease [Chlamydia gallinacea]